MAQSTALLTGTVVDSSGAAVPSASVVCTNTETGLRTTSTTNSAGLFRLPDLPVGTYELTAAHDGFSTVVRGGILLLTGQTVDVTVTLKVGQATQRVEVMGQAPLVQSTTSEMQTSVDARQMEDLPLNGRNAFDLAALMPGAVQTDAETIPGQQDNTGLAVNGFRSTDNNWQLDGGTYTNRHFGSAPTLPNPDTLQEFTVRTSNFSAENRGGGAVVKLTTRSGTNQVHGSVFEFLRNDAMDARNFFSLTPEKYKMNQYGGTVGGPIRHDKLFYFASFQGTNKRGNPSPRVLTVPTEQQRAGDFNASGKIVVDPLNGQPFAGNVIPRSRMDPIALGLLPFIPLPNAGGNNLVTPPPSGRDDYQWLAKIDYVVSSKDRLSGRYFWDKNTLERDTTSVPGVFGSNSYKNWTVLVSNTYTFSPTWVMSASFNYLRTFRTEAPVTPVTMQGLGAKVPLAEESVPDKIFVTINGYTRLFTARGIKFYPEIAEVNPEFSHAAGKHFIRFGSGIRHNVEYALNLGDDRGSWTFTAQRTTSAAVRNSGDAFASMLLGVPQTFAENSTVPQRFVLNTFDTWVQDDWRVHRRLTFNLGLRFEPWLPVHDELGVLAGFVPGMRSSIAPLAPVGMVFSGDPGIPASIMRNHWNQWSPRFGFALDVMGDGKKVLRGGYGIYRSGTEFFGMQRGFANSTPTRSASVSITAPPSTADPYAGYTGKIPFPFVQPTREQLATYAFPASMTLGALDPNARPMYTQSWNLTAEHQLRGDLAVSLSWVGNHFLNALTRVEANPAIYGPGATTGNTAARRIYKGFTAITLGTSIGSGYYNAMQFQLTKRAAHGLTLLANYTWGKAIDVDSSGAFGGAGGEAPRNPFNVALDRGPADFDVQHSFKAAAVYDFPVLRKGNGVARAIMNGWQLNGIVTARTGFPMTCRSGVDNSLTGVGNDTCDQITASTGRPAGADPYQMWFNTAAFVPNAIGTFGNAGRNSLRRPGYENVNLSVFRKFRVSERAFVELRGEAFNALNHTNPDLFFNPSGYQASQDRTSPTFGKVTHAQDPRLMQVALKVRF